MFRLDGEISYLVPFDEDHLNNKDYLSWLRDYDVIKTINRLDYVRPISFAEVKGYCESVMQSKDDIFLAIYEKKENSFIGTMKLKINWVTRAADVGILIGNKELWGKGIGTDSVKTAGRYLFDTLGMRKLTSGLMDINPGMLKVFERAGFKQEGVFRKQDFFEGGYVDHIYFGCFKDEFQR